MIKTLETPDGVKWNIDHCYEAMKKFDVGSVEYHQAEYILGYILNKYRRQQKAEMYSEVLIKGLVKKI